MRKTENTISLLGGALLGAAAMYLLDPEMGRRRREALADRAQDAWENAGDTVSGGWDSLTDRARGWGQGIADKAQEYGQKISGSARDMHSSLSDRMDDLRSRSSDAASSYADSARDMRDDAAGYARRVWDRLRDLGSNVSPGHLMDALRHKGTETARRARSAAADAGLVERETPIMPITLTGLGCCALGVGAMYFLDPQRGRARRAWAQDKASSIVRQTGRFAYRTGQDMINRTTGLAAETRGKFRSSGPVGSEQLVQRVRSDMGRVVSSPRLVQVMADGNGCVTLTGSVLASEADRLRACVEAVPGVNLVVNRLEVHDTVEGLQRAASQQAQSVPQL